LDSRSTQTRAARAVTARQLKSMLHDGGEIAVLDVREEGIFAKRHLLLACSAPLSQLELRAPLLVPRRSTRVVLVDDDNGLAQRAADVLIDNGYTDVALLAGGVDAWAAAAYEIYSGVNVPSKAFGEFVEHHDQTPRMEAAEIKAKVERGEKIVILDSRPLHEYKKVSIPGGIDCPGAELAFRAHDMIPSADALVVVNCAGRTRSIIGAQSLINAGIPNRVVALKNGTMGWHLAGFQVAHDQELIAPPPTAVGLRKAREAAARVARRFGVQYINVAKVAEFAREMDKRTLFLFDVRSPEEYAAGHLHSTVSAPGGQLVQTTDSFAGVRNSRIVLVDDHGVRATMTASWLLQMGWAEVFVVEGAALSSTAPAIAPTEPQCAALAPRDLEKKKDALVLDFASSLQYRAGHVPGAAFAIRSRLANHRDLFGDRNIVCTSPDGQLARYAASDLAALLGREVHALQGGTGAWRAAGLPLESGETRMLEPPEDVYYKPYDHKAQIEAAMQDYLQWEVALLEQIRRDPDCRFRNFPGRP
jgi:rhodanese-related sulfurtransferase